MNWNSAPKFVLINCVSVPSFNLPVQTVRSKICRKHTDFGNFLFPLINVLFFSFVSESQTIEDFGAALHLMRSDLEHLRSVFMAVENGDLGMLKSLGIKDSELGDVKFFLEKLVNTGFLDWGEFEPLRVPFPILLL